MAEPVFRTMTVADLDAVVALERMSFSLPWSRTAFYTEVTENEYARYVVAELEGRVIGYAGMWLICDEAHVTNIAIHPDWRGQKLGERLLCALMDRAREEGATKMTLEVRPSNMVARRLYQKLGFVVRGQRKQYYTDTREDALIMWRDKL